jgi:Resolvase, N terminal domain
MATYGYARVSSSDQSTDTQFQKLKAAGCHVVRTEKLSGKSREGRDQLATLLEFSGPCDVVGIAEGDSLFFDLVFTSSNSVAVTDDACINRGTMRVQSSPPARPTNRARPWQGR